MKIRIKKYSELLFLFSLHKSSIMRKKLQELDKNIKTTVYIGVGNENCEPAQTKKTWIQFSSSVLEFGSKTAWL